MKHPSHSSKKIEMGFFPEKNRTFPKSRDIWLPLPRRTHLHITLFPIWFFSRRGRRKSPFPPTRHFPPSKRPPPILGRDKRGEKKSCTFLRRQRKGDKDGRVIFWQFQLTHSGCPYALFKEKGYAMMQYFFISRTLLLCLIPATTQAVFSHLPNITMTKSVSGLALRVKSESGVRSF